MTPSPRALELITRVVHLAGDRDFLGATRESLERAGVQQAVASHDSARLFDWLMGGLSFQGVADSVAGGYIERHGNATYAGLTRYIVDGEAACSKLAGFDAYIGCRYRKAARTCANLDAFDVCTVPRLPLRNGHLNRLAFSLFLFIRDVCRGDLVAFLDDRLAAADQPGAPDRLPRMRTAFLADLSAVHGVGKKVLSMVFSELLLCGDSGRQRWMEVGGSLIAVDRLVHKFFHRTGILDEVGARHGFGSACYGPNGCAALLDAVARHTDARAINPTYPATFPRFVQHAIWRFCAEGEFDICNGRQIDDRDRCANVECVAYELCARVALRPPTAEDSLEGR